MEIRTATPEDDEAIGELLVQAFTVTYARKMPEVVVTPQRQEELRRTAEKRAHAMVLVAVEDGRVVGTVSLFPEGAAGSEAWLPHAADLRHLAVEPRYHGHGVSGLLLEETERLARSWDLEAICLHV